MVTLWSPQELPADQPKYLAIADAIAGAIAGGSLAAGDRLPTHRQLAQTLGVTIGTVTRGYAEAARRGLVDATIGRGTFVMAQQQREIGCTPLEAVPGAIELGLNCPSPLPDSPDLIAAFESLPRSPHWNAALGYGEITGQHRHRAIVADWLTGRGVPATADQITIAAGCQQAILLAFAAACRPGDVVLVEELSYMGALASAHLLDLRIETVAMDHDGVIPADFEQACARHRPTAFYCIPTLQNPTAIVMSPARRRAIARLADAAGVTVIEDGVQSYLLPQAPPPLATLVERPAFHTTSLSKSVAGGLRVGFLWCSDGPNARVEETIWATTLNAPAPLVEIATSLLAGGGVDRIEAERRRVARTRNAMAQELLGDWIAPGSVPESQFVWLEQPDWNVERIVDRAAANGVRVLGAREFATDRRTNRQGIRVALAHETDDERLRDGLERLRQSILGGARANGTGNRGRMPGV
ncbi:MAG: PLP-dependent aminotransferase family protein [bacterium]|nr:PLP-dependent aminotransferase family protein [bacterium]